MNNETRRTALRERLVSLLCRLALVPTAVAASKPRTVSGAYERGLRRLRWLLRSMGLPTRHGRVVMLGHLAEEALGDSYLWRVVYDDGDFWRPIDPTSAVESIWRDLRLAVAQSAPCPLGGNVSVELDTRYVTVGPVL